MKKDVKRYADLRVVAILATEMERELAKAYTYLRHAVGREEAENRTSEVDLNIQELKNWIYEQLNETMANLKEEDE